MDLKVLHGTAKRVTVVEFSITSETESVYEDSQYAGERSRFDEPTCSFKLDATGVPSELSKRLSAVVGEILKLDGVRIGK